MMISPSRVRLSCSAVVECAELTLVPLRPSLLHSHLVSVDRLASLHHLSPSSPTPPTDIWHGSVNQESASVITLTDDTSYDGKGYTTFGYEYEPGSDGHITWAVNATPSWTLNSEAIGPDPEAQISQRLISEEPMSIILNLGM